MRDRLLSRDASCFTFVEVEKSEAEFITSVYRKPTFTGQYLRRTLFVYPRGKLI